MQMMIPDGYTRRCTLPATEWYDEFRFSYRPMVQHERMLHRDRMEAIKGEAKAQLEAENLMAERIVEWDLDDKIDTENIRRLQPNLSGKIYQIIYGLEVPPGCDDDDEADAKNS